MEGQPKAKKDKRITRGSKQEAGRANLRKREKANVLLGLKNGQGGPNLGKKQKTNGLVGA